MKNAWQLAKPLIGYILGELIAWIYLVWNVQMNPPDLVYLNLADSTIVAWVTNPWIIGPVFLVGLGISPVFTGVELGLVLGMMFGLAWLPITLGLLVPVLLVGILCLVGIIASAWRFLLVATFLTAVVVAWRRAERDPDS